MRINVAVPEAHVEAPVLNAALEAVTRLNEAMMQKGELPSWRKALASGVRWQPEPPGDEHFDHGKTVIARKWGDCDDIAPLAAASLRHSGEDPGATAIVRKSGPKTWHAVVQRSDGSIDDPSREAGMGRRGRGVVGAGLPRMIAPSSSVVGAYIIRPQIALRPVRGAYQARADLPWHWREHLESDKPSQMDYAMTTLHTAPVAHTALVGALDGAVRLAIASGYGDPDHLDRLCCIADAVEGVPYHQLCGVYGEDHARAASAVVGSFFGSLAKGLKNVVAPIATKALNFIPGVGPVASMAAEAGLKALNKATAPKAAPATASQSSALSTPVIVRAPVNYQPPPVTAQPAYRPPGAAATEHPLGRLRPGGVDLLRTLIFE